MADSANATVTPSKKGVDLNELQGEVERMLELLKNRQPGLATWNSWMKERMEGLHRLTSEALR